MTERYYYEDRVLKDVLDEIQNQYSEDEIIQRLQEDRDDFERELYDDFFVRDSVTGNASGSYTFNAWRAEEYVCHNLDLLAEAAEEFGSDVDLLKSGAEACDVTIRCYLLGQCISKALDQLEEQYGL